MGRENSLSGALLALLGLAGCGQEPSALPPYGEVLVEVDTNLRVPQTLSRVRFDLFDSERRWLVSRDEATPAADDFPLSFSLYNDSPDQRRTAWLRVRGYLEGRLRDYRGEQFAERPEFEAPAVSQSLKQACRDAPLLNAGQSGALRLRGEAFGGNQLSCEAAGGGYTKRTRSGLAVFRLSVEVPGRYRVAVTSAQPGVEWASVADTVLSLRSNCEAAESELACNDDEQRELGNLAGVNQELEPGEYFALIGNVAPGPMDVTLQFEQPESQSTEPVAGGGELLDNGPRLLEDGIDVTPQSEPEPHLTVDRLLRLDVEPQRRTTARVLLDGECMGSMADLAGGRSCVDTETELLPVEPQPLLPGRLHSSSSAVGTWSKYQSQACASDAVPHAHPELHDDRVCVSGGTFVLGDPTLIARDPDDGSPERLATIPTFLMDRYEYSVARYRAARARGFVPPDAGPLNNFEPVTLDTDDLTRACTWNEGLDGSSLFPSQEALPLSCVSWLTARALCDLEGGRLPSVAEREYVASAAERELESTYPWGEQAPTCDQVVFGRWLEPSRGSSSCYDALHAFGPSAVDAEPWSSFDRSPCGVVGLGGNVAEWTRDSHRAYSDACWQSQPHLAPECTEDEAPLRTIAGGSWRSPAAGTRAALRIGGAVAGVDPWVGLRCVYSVGTP
ncbi:MAG: SUMF1/EgtB/PvdO family nonheme iron enzyme [Myxococcales bacterium]